MTCSLDGHVRGVAAPPSYFTHTHTCGLKCFSGILSSAHRFTMQVTISTPLHIDGFHVRSDLVEINQPPGQLTLF